MTVARDRRSHPRVAAAVSAAAGVVAASSAFGRRRDACGHNPGDLTVTVPVPVPVAVAADREGGAFLPLLGDDHDNGNGFGLGGERVV